ncbi:MAG: lipid kinase [Candidatus Eremiobacteraeota bacterium]|nr:lipid kinase [Candidatus Eremiobacteraeota bacterium]
MQSFVSPSAGYGKVTVRILLLLNPNARRGAQSAEAVEKAFDVEQCEVIREEPDQNDGGARIMKRYVGEVDCVAVGGGDGTLINAIPGLIETKLPLGILPLGTFNDLAKTLGVPVDLEGAVRVILDGNKRALDVGRVAGRYFLNEASIGISTRIARRQTPEAKKRFGFLAIIATTLAALVKSRPFSATVRYDGKEERFRTLQLTVANSHHFGGFITNKDAAIDDGMLDLYSLDIHNWADVMRLLGPIARHEISQSPAVRNRKSTQFEVLTTRPRAVFTDGEPAAMTPAMFTVLPAAIEVFVPRDGTPSK